MAPQTATRMTYEEFMALPDDGKHYELIEGELVLNPAPNMRHQSIQWRIASALSRYLEAHPIGRGFNAPTDVVLNDDVILEPDLLVILNEHTSILGVNNVQGAPDIALEILSPGTRRKDEIVKKRLYEHHGVNEYWVVDPDAELVKIYRREGTAFAHPIVIDTEAGGAITSPLLPGFSLDVRDVFAE
jgi:Uma2 family endonuclease